MKQSKIKRKIKEDLKRSLANTNPSNEALVKVLREVIGYEQPTSR